MKNLIKMMPAVACFLALAGVGMPQTAVAETDGAAVRENAVSLDSVLDYLATASRAREDVQLATAPIKSRTGLDERLENDGYPAPLLALSVPARDAFLGSLTFNETGLTGYNVGILEDSSLTVTEAWKILQLFGAQGTISLLDNLAVRTSQDRQILSQVNQGSGLQFWRNGREKNRNGDCKGYNCIAGSCQPASGMICMNNCGG